MRSVTVVLLLCFSMPCIASSFIREIKLGDDAVSRIQAEEPDLLRRYVDGGDLVIYVGTWRSWHILTFYCDREEDGRRSSWSGVFRVDTSDLRIPEESVIDLTGMQSTDGMSGRRIEEITDQGVRLSDVLSRRIRIDQKTLQGEKAAQPGATDNPGDAQRSREDH